MSRRAALPAALAALVASAASVALLAGPSAATTGGARAKTERVKVADDYFAPEKLKIKQRNAVKWKWDPANLDTHNVVLKKAPRKVDKKDFRSKSGSYGIRFKKKFRVAGTYDFVCTFHKSVMKMTVKVKRKR